MSSSSGRPPISLVIVRKGPTINKNNNNNTPSRAFSTRGPLPPGVTEMEPPTTEPEWNYGTTFPSFPLPAVADEEQDTHKPLTSPSAATTATCSSRQSGGESSQSLHSVLLPQSPEQRQRMNKFWELQDLHQIQQMEDSEQSYGGGTASVAAASLTEPPEERCMTTVEGGGKQRNRAGPLPPLPPSRKAQERVNCNNDNEEELVKGDINSNKTVANEDDGNDDEEEDDNDGEEEGNLNGRPKDDGVSIEAVSADDSPAKEDDDDDDENNHEIGAGHEPQLDGTNTEANKETIDSTVHPLDQTKTTDKREMTRHSSEKHNTGGRVVMNHDTGSKGTHHRCGGNSILEDCGSGAWFCSSRDETNRNVEESFRGTTGTDTRKALTTTNPQPMDAEQELLLQLEEEEKRLSQQEEELLEQLHQERERFQRDGTEPKEENQPKPANDDGESIPLDDEERRLLEEEQLLEEELTAWLDGALQQTPERSTQPLELELNPVQGRHVPDVAKPTKKDENVVLSPRISSPPSSPGSRPSLLSPSRTGNDKYDQTRSSFSPLERRSGNNTHQRTLIPQGPATSTTTTMTPSNGGDEARKSRLLSSSSSSCSFQPRNANWNSVTAHSTITTGSSSGSRNGNPRNKAAPPRISPSSRLLQPTASFSTGRGRTDQKQFGKNTPMTTTMAKKPMVTPTPGTAPTPKPNTAMNETSRSSTIMAAAAVSETNKTTPEGSRPENCTVEARTTTTFSAEGKPRVKNQLNPTPNIATVSRNSTRTPPTTPRSNRGIGNTAVTPTNPTTPTTTTTRSLRRNMTPEEGQARARARVYLRQTLQQQQQQQQGGKENTFHPSKICWNSSTFPHVKRLAQVAQTTSDLYGESRPENDLSRTEESRNTCTPPDHEETDDGMEKVEMDNPQAPSHHQGFHKNSNAGEKTFTTGGWKEPTIQPQPRKPIPAVDGCNKTNRHGTSEFVPTRPQEFQFATAQRAARTRRSSSSSTTTENKNGVPPTRPCTLSGNHKNRIMPSRPSISSIMTTTATTTIQQRRPLTVPVAPKFLLDAKYGSKSSTSAPESKIPRPSTSGSSSASATAPCRGVNRGTGVNSLTKGSVSGDDEASTATGMASESKRTRSFHHRNNNNNNIYRHSSNSVTPARALSACGSRRPLTVPVAPNFLLDAKYGSRIPSSSIPPPKRHSAARQPPNQSTTTTGYPPRTTPTPSQNLTTTPTASTTPMVPTVDNM